jgi:hypothetical protein
LHAIATVKKEVRAVLFDKYQIHQMGFGGNVRCRKDSEVYKKLMALLDSGETHEMAIEDLCLVSKMRVTTCFLDSDGEADFSLVLSSEAPEKE